MHIPESDKFLLLKSGILRIGIRNTAHESGILLKIGIQNPSFTNSLESSTWNPESEAWNPESKTVLDSLTFVDLSFSTYNCIVFHFHSGPKWLIFSASSGRDLYKESHFWNKTAQTKHMDQISLYGWDTAHFTLVLMRE